MTNDILIQEGYESSTLVSLASSASNIRFGDNPLYELSDFLKIYPQFGPVDYFDEDGVVKVSPPPSGSWPLPETVLQLYVTLASASLSQARWLDWWEVGMGFFIAHFATLFLQGQVAAGSSAARIAQAGAARGLLASKSAGDVSAGYDFGTVMGQISGFAIWKLTIFGQQLANIANLVGMGPMWIY
jgi:hypothetical protein